MATTLFYKSMDGVAALLGMKTLTMAVMIYQTINFHHYIADAVIWKLRKPTIRAQVGIATS